MANQEKMSEPSSDCQKDMMEIPETFPFPYEKPYSIQLDFMKALYKTLESKKIGIFESPTGTVSENNCKPILSLIGSFLNFQL